MAGRYRTASEPECCETGAVVEYVHPVSGRILRTAPLLGYIPVFSNTFQAFHPKFVLAICTQHLSEKGLAKGLMRNSIQPTPT
ncbi:hypothetical protein N2W54_002893 [Lotmaria passim]